MIASAGNAASVVIVVSVANAVMTGVTAMMGRPARLDLQGRRDPQAAGPASRDPLDLPVNPPALERPDRPGLAAPVTRDQQDLAQQSPARRALSDRPDQPD